MLGDMMSVIIQDVYIVRFGLTFFSMHHQHDSITNQRKP
jgi:hypothetical protein